MMYSFVPTFVTATVALFLTTISSDDFGAEARLEVIGTGFGRTGTDSLKEAMNILGYKTYHMKEIAQRYMPDHLLKWKYLMENDCQTPDAKELFEEMFNSHEYTAAIGVTAFCFEELVKQYPDAKFVHTERTSAELWQASATDTLCTAPDTPFMKIAIKLRISLFRNLKAFVLTAMQVRFMRNPDITDVNPQMCRDHKEEMISAYKAHNVLVKKKVPRKKLLVITNHKDGWGPLCNFLDKEIPDQPFPHANSRANFKIMVAESINKQLSKFIIGVFLLVAAVLAHRTYRQNKEAAKRGYKKSK